MYQDKKIFVVLPALNEEELIGSVIEKIPKFVDQVVVIDDGSKDKTAEIAKSLGALVVSHGKNLGVGKALQSGIQVALGNGADIMVNMDADGQFNPEDIEKLIRPIVLKQADFVTASRFKDTALIPIMPKVKYFGNRMMSFFVSRVCDQKFFDVSCGFRAYSQLSLLKLNLFGHFTYTQEMFIDMVYKGMTIIEVPLKIRGTREIGSSRVASNLWKYAFQTFKIIVKTLRDYNPFKLFSFFGNVSFLLGALLGGFLMVHYLKNGQFSPHKWAGFLSGFWIMMAVLFYAIGFIMDMFARMRFNQEEILFQVKKNSTVK